MHWVLPGCRMRDDDGGIFGVIKFFMVSSKQIYFDIQSALHQNTIMLAWKLRKVSGIKWPRPAKEDTPRVSPWRSRSSPGVCPWCPPTCLSRRRWSTSRSERTSMMYFLRLDQWITNNLLMYLQTLGKLFASSPNKRCLDFFFDQSNIEVIESI